MKRNSFKEMNWSKFGKRWAVSEFYPFTIRIVADSSTCIIEDVEATLIGGAPMPEYRTEELFKLLPMKPGGFYLDWVDRETLIPILARGVS